MVGAQTKTNEKIPTNKKSSENKDLIKYFFEVPFNVFSACPSVIKVNVIKFHDAQR